MKVLLKQGVYIESIHGNIDILKTEVFNVLVRKEDRNKGYGYKDTTTLYLKSKTDHWWIEGDEFKKGVLEGKIVIINYKRKAVFEI